MEFNLIVLNIFFALIFFFFLDKISKFTQLYDLPNSRKIHKKPIPLIGGLILYIIILINFLIFRNITFEILMISTGYFFIGFIDDAKKISASFRLIVLSIITYIFLTFFEKFKINFIHFEGMGKIYFEEYSLIFTVLCVLLFQNAMNMIDGINGQSGLIFLIILLFLLKKIGLNYELLLLISLIIIFIFFNLRNKIFLGDAGIYFLSSFLAFNVILISNENLIYSEEIFLIMMLPGLDMLRLFIIRIINKKNPFKPDTFHIHHLVSKKLKSKLKTLFLIISIYLIPILLSEFTSIKKLSLVIFGLFCYLLTIYYFNGFKIYDQKK